MLGIDQKRKQRFSLLLLEEGENYFDDCSAYYYPPARNLSDSVKKRVKGRLKTCTRSVIFDPDDIRTPVMKFPFKDTESVKPWAPPLQTQAPTEFIELDTTAVTNILENNVIAPYQVVKVADVKHRFSLNFAAMNAVLPRMQLIHKLAKRPHDEREMVKDQLKLLLSETQEGMKFDPSWLEDLDEQILLETTGARITPLTEEPGRIVITNKRVYLQPFNNIASEPVLKFRVDEVTRFSRRRHMLRHLGLECFFSKRFQNGRFLSVFFSFGSHDDREKVYLKLLSMTASMPELGVSSIASATQLWFEGKMSNYDYLLTLNSFAGRTFNDLTQYPVFPWVVADYTSSTLRLDDPATYRDLSKPVGALNENRLSLLKERYRHMEDDPDTKPFLYGTHYSTPGYVLYYLVRQYPQYMLRLQNGKFDAADRLFVDIEASWKSVTTNPADVKELIPEFYDVDDNPGAFLENALHLDLGVRQNGQRVNDATLPPWAASSSDYVRKMREALESPFVSAHLHEWIDLIFGYRQRGDEAVKADNVFYHLTYEGAVDIDAVVNLEERISLERQIGEFGQTPSQLFTRPHPPRGKKGAVLAPAPPPLASPVQPDAASNAPSALETALPSRSERSPSLPPMQDLCLSPMKAATLLDIPSSDAIPPPSAIDGAGKVSDGPAIDASAETAGTDTKGAAKDTKEAVPGDSGWEGFQSFTCVQSIKIHRDVITAICLSEDGNIVFSASQDSALKIYSLQEKRQLRSFTIGTLALSSILLSPSTRAQQTITAGSWDNNIYVYSVDYGRVLQSLPAHDDAVSCLRICGDLLVSASWDSSVKLWKVGSDGLLGKAPLAELLEHDAEVKCVAINEGVRAEDVVRGASGGNDGTVVEWDLQQQRCTDTRQPHSDEVTDIHMVGDGRVYVTSSVDGTVKVVDTRMVADPLVISAGCPVRSLRTNGLQVVAGCDNGSIMLYDVRTGQSFGTLKSGSRPVTCLEVPPTGKALFAGCEDYSVQHYTVQA